MNATPPAGKGAPQSARKGGGGSSLAQLRTLAQVVRDRQIRLLLSLSRKLVTPLYRAAFLSGAAGSGLLRALGERPRDLREVAAELGGTPDVHRLRVWLDVGVKLGELERRDGRYGLKSRLAKGLAERENDALAGALQEVTHFHYPVLMEAPQMVRDDRYFSLSDQDGEIIARSSLIVRPFIEEAIARTLPRDRPVRLLEIGCGSGLYVRHAAALNPRLTALAVDLQPEVAEQAAANMSDWGLSDRVQTRQGDLRKLDLDEQFDLVTMHNNIYYFPEADRVEVLKQARSLVAPGGRLLLTTSCQGGGPELEVLNLWFEYADFGGALPYEHELVAQLEEAGFADVSASRIIPGEQFRAFTGTHAHAAH
ncbi:cyclopropane-fatty-acyl-phospholipid synthase family protein [Streptomyces sp. JJ36]|uniref:SAM-dependent methyltransferase n=1 Tax=Streptomyces sp. JJ36 TaxID=2736645 RepID=UPI001F1579F8|nr:class I SAM-dependent methyltransferase [Streptomyces sp. JJ36]MCF6521790.1 methyltransferase domain-containing protein [Streptomyces sp. JJ36]